MSDELVLVQNLIHEIRGKKVMLDFDLARLYHVTTSALNQAVKRNIKRFPPDFMFRITAEEWASNSSQIVTTSNRPKKALPFAFTEQGVTMLSGVLKSDIAIAANLPRSWKKRRKPRCPESVSSRRPGRTIRSGRKAPEGIDTKKALRGLPAVR